jgi:hypothetical protein
MKRLILTREDFRGLPEVVIQLMDFVLVEEIEEQPFRYVIEKNLGGTVGDVTYEQATEILESLV